MNEASPYTRQMIRSQSIGQTLYVGDAQLVDSAGKGIPGGFFYVDGTGARLSQEFPTDNNGVFHWDIDDSSIATTFVNVYGSAEYVPRVLSPDELIANSKIVLDSVHPQTSAALPWVIGAGVVGLLLVGGKKKKIGATFVERAHSKYKSLNPTTQKIILIGAGGVVAYFLIKEFFGYKKTPGQSAELKAAQDKLAYLAAEFGIVPTLSDAQFSEMCNVIVTAVDDCGTDESAIYSQFNKLSNEADLWKLIAVYDVRGYKGCFEGSYFGDVHHTLSETLSADMSSSEISNINAILSDKNIPYAF